MNLITSFSLLAYLLSISLGYEARRQVVSHLHYKLSHICIFNLCELFLLAIVCP